MATDQLRYSTGEIVQVGDRVIYEDWYGVVIEIVLPDSDDNLHWPHYGITIALNKRGIEEINGTPATDENVMWRITKFLHRGTLIPLPYGSGTRPWPYEQGPFGGGPAPTGSLE
jgi:hypothetical protein